MDRIKMRSLSRKSQNTISLLDSNDHRFNQTSKTTFRVKKTSSPSLKSIVIPNSNKILAGPHSINQKSKTSKNGFNRTMSKTSSSLRAFKPKNTSSSRVKNSEKMLISKMVIQENRSSQFSIGLNFTENNKKKQPKFVKSQAPNNLFVSKSKSRNKNILEKTPFSKNEILNTLRSLKSDQKSMSGFSESLKQMYLKTSRSGQKMQNSENDQKYSKDPLKVSQKYVSHYSSLIKSSKNLENKISDLQKSRNISFIDNKASILKNQKIMKEINQDFTLEDKKRGGYLLQQTLKPQEEKEELKKNQNYLPNSLEEIKLILDYHDFKRPTEQFWDTVFCKAPYSPKKMSKKVIKDNTTAIGTKNCTKTDIFRLHGCWERQDILHIITWFKEICSSPGLLQLKNRDVKDYLKRKGDLISFYQRELILNEKLWCKDKARSLEIAYDKFIEYFDEWNIYQTSILDGLKLEFNEQKNNMKKNIEEEKLKFQAMNDKLKAQMTEETMKRIEAEHRNRVLKSKLMNDYFLIRHLKSELDYSEESSRILREENKNVFGKFEELSIEMQSLDFLKRPLKILQQKFLEIQKVRNTFRSQIRTMDFSKEHDPILNDRNYMEGNTENMMKKHIATTFGGKIEDIMFMTREVSMQTQPFKEPKKDVKDKIVQIDLKSEKMSPSKSRLSKKRGKRSATSMLPYNFNLDQVQLQNVVLQKFTTGVIKKSFVHSERIIAKPHPGKKITPFEDNFNSDSDNEDNIQEKQISLGSQSSQEGDEDLSESMMDQMEREYDNKQISKLQKQMEFENSESHLLATDQGNISATKNKRNPGSGNFHYDLKENGSPHMLRKNIDRVDSPCISFINEVELYKSRKNVVIRSPTAVEGRSNLVVPRFDTQENQTSGNEDSLKDSGSILNSTKKNKSKRGSKIFGNNRLKKHKTFTQGGSSTKIYYSQATIANGQNYGSATKGTGYVKKAIALRNEMIQNSTLLFNKVLLKINQRKLKSMRDNLSMRQTSLEKNIVKIYLEYFDWLKKKKHLPTNFSFFVYKYLGYSSSSKKFQEKQYKTVIYIFSNQ